MSTDDLPDELHVERVDNASGRIRASAGPRDYTTRYVRAQEDDVGDAPDEVYRCTLCPPEHQWSAETHRHSAPRAGGGGLQDASVRFVRADLDQTAPLLELLRSVLPHIRDDDNGAVAFDRAKAVLVASGYNE